MNLRAGERAGAFVRHREVRPDAEVEHSSDPLPDPLPQAGEGEVLPSRGRLVQQPARSFAAVESDSESTLDAHFGTHRLAGRQLRAVALSVAGPLGPRTGRGGRISTTTFQHGRSRDE